VNGFFLKATSNVLVVKLKADNPQPRVPSPTLYTKLKVSNIILALTMEKRRNYESTKKNNYLL